MASTFELMETMCTVHQKEIIWYWIKTTKEDIYMKNC